MKLYSTILFFVAASVFLACAETPAGWSTNYADTMSTAESTQQPILVYFTASWCGPCKLMSRITLTDPAVTQAISGIEYVAVDIDEHPDIALKHGISAVPTFIMLSATEDEVERTTGFQAIVDFLPWLTNSISEAKEDMVRQALSKKNLADVDQLLASTETNSIHQAVEKLFDLCDERDKAIIQAAADRLKTVASREPTALLDGLIDPRLATRIQVANALHDKIGDAFDVDPWSDAATRENEILVWRKQLTETSISN